MNERLRKLNPETLLFWDIETVRRQKELDVDSEEFALYQYKNRDKDTMALMPNEEVIKHYEKNAALFPTYNRIVCISVGFIQGDTFFYKSLTGDQKDIITEFYELVNSRPWVPTSYNGIRFDTPTVRLKAFECGVETILKENMCDSETKPWEFTASNLDLMNILQGTYFNSLSFAETCFLLGVKTPKGDISGADVSRVFWDEGESGLERIATYCNEDIRALAEVFFAIRGQKGFLKNFINRTGVKQEKPKLFDVIANTKKVTKEQQKEILAKAKGLTKEEKEGFVTLLKAALLEESENYEDLFLKLSK